MTDPQTTKDKDGPPFGNATTAQLFTALGSKEPEKDERELNAIIRRMKIRENNK
jgi:hypothetical protein